MTRCSREDEDENINDLESVEKDSTSHPPAGFSIPDAVHSLSEAVYATDLQERITFFNSAAAEMWGATPPPGTSEFDGIWRLLHSDGSAVAPQENPITLVLKYGCAIRGFEALGERRDGRRVPFVAFPSPLRDREGRIVGAVNLLVGLGDGVVGERAMQRLAAIIESSEDAIIAKDINGVITDWNAGATRLFGYTEEEAVGRPVAMLIPSDRHDEEPDILARLRRGERIEHYETIRKRKDGSLVDISLSVSPIKNRSGRVVGASKIARDITAKRRAEEQKTLLLSEMNHRIKNLFTLAGSIVTLSGRSANSRSDLVSAVTDRLGALARAHTLAIPQITDAGVHIERHATLQSLIETILAPYQGGDPQARIEVNCCDFTVRGDSVTGIALLINEFATNAAKYGSLSNPDGRVEIHCVEHQEYIVVQWREIGGPSLQLPVAADGFGSRLVKATVNGQFSGEITREWLPEGLEIKLRIPAGRIRAA